MSSATGSSQDPNGQPSARRRAEPPKTEAALIPTGCVDKVRALHSFTSPDAKCMSFAKGDMIYVVVQDKSGWWNGTVNGRRGWFPSNFVKSVGLSTDEKELLAQRASAVPSAAGATQTAQPQAIPASGAPPQTKATWVTAASRSANQSLTSLASSPSSSSSTSSGLGTTQSDSHPKRGDSLAAASQRGALPTLTLEPNQPGGGSQTQLQRMPQSLSASGRLRDRRPSVSGWTVDVGSLLDPQTQQITWNVLINNILNAISKLNEAGKDGRKNRYIQLTNVVVQAIRDVLVSAGLIDTESPIYQKYRVLRSHHHNIVKSLSKMILAAKIASGIWPPADAVNRMRFQAGQVLLAIRHFVSAAQSYNIELVPASAQMLVLEQQNRPVSDFDAFGTAMSEDEYVAKLDQYSEANTTAVNRLLMLLQSTVERDATPAVAQQALVQHTAAIVSGVGQLLSLIDDIEVLESVEAKSIATEFSENRLVVFSLVNEFMSLAQLALEPYAPANALAQLYDTARELLRKMETLVMATKLVIDQHDLLVQRNMQDTVNLIEEASKRDSDLLQLQRRAMSLTFADSVLAGDYAEGSPESDPALNSVRPQQPASRMHPQSGSRTASGGTGAALLQSASDPTIYSQLQQQRVAQALAAAAPPATNEKGQIVHRSPLHMSVHPQSSSSLSISSSTSSTKSSGHPSNDTGPSAVSGSIQPASMASSGSSSSLRNTSGSSRRKVSSVGDIPVQYRGTQLPTTLLGSAESLQNSTSSLIPAIPEIPSINVDSGNYTEATVGTSVASDAAVSLPVRTDASRIPANMRHRELLAAGTQRSATPTLDPQGHVRSGSGAGSDQTDLLFKIMNSLADNVHPSLPRKIQLAPELVDPNSAALSRGKTPGATQSSGANAVVSHSRSNSAQMQSAAPAAADGANLEWMLWEPEYESWELAVSEQQDILGGTRRALFEVLTSHRHRPDERFVHSFLFTFRLFMTPAELVDAFRNRLLLKPPENLSENLLNEWREQKQATIRLRSWNALKLWIESFWFEPEDERVVGKLIILADDLSAAHVSQGARLHDLLEQRFAMSGGPSGPSALHQGTRRVSTSAPGLSESDGLRGNELVGANLRQSDLQPSAGPSPHAASSGGPASGSSGTPSMATPLGPGLSASAGGAASGNAQPFRRRFGSISNPFGNSGGSFLGNSSSSSSSTATTSHNGAAPTNGSSFNTASFNGHASIDGSAHGLAPFPGADSARESMAGLGSINGITSVLDVEATDMARQITIVDWRLFSSIRPAEFLRQEWTRKGTAIATGICATIRFSTLLSEWAMFLILHETDAKKRAALIKYFVKVADRCRSINNYNSVMAILSALNSAPISRLKRTWDQVPSKYRNVFASLRAVMDHGRNFAVYRQAIRTVSLPCLPFLGLFLTDLVFTDEGNPKMRNQGHLINFDKYRKIARIVLEDGVAYYQQQVQAGCIFGPSQIQKAAPLLAPLLLQSAPATSPGGCLNSLTVSNGQAQARSSMGAPQPSRNSAIPDELAATSGVGYRYPEILAIQIFIRSELEKLTPQSAEWWYQLSLEREPRDESSANGHSSTGSGRNRAQSVVNFASLLHGESQSNSNAS